MWIHTWSHISTITAIQQRPEAICVIINETTVHFSDMLNNLLLHDVNSWPVTYVETRDPAY